MNEQFSAFLDNEASGDEADAVVNALLRDKALRESWSRQHWLRTTLRAHAGEVAVALDADFSNRVMSAIARDDTPRATLQPAMARSRPVRRRRWRSMAGLAAAASATGFVLLVSNPVQRDGDGPTAAVPTSVAASGNVSTATTQVASNGLSGDMLESSNARPAAVRQGPADHWSVSDPALEDELNGYLVDHNGLARGYGLAGTTPAFVRVATYGQESTQ